MAIEKICMLAITGISAALVIKQWKGELLPLLRLALVVLLTAAAIGEAAPLISYMKELMGESSLLAYAEILFKALAVALLTGTCSSICRECGENGIAEGVELVGKVEILLLALPLVRELLTAAVELLSFGD